MSSSSLCMSDEEAIFSTPAKRRYTRSIFQGKHKQKKSLDFQNVLPSTSVQKKSYTSSEEESNEMHIQNNLLDTSWISDNPSIQPENLESSDLSTNYDEIDLSISDEDSVFCPSEENEDDPETLDFDSDNDHGHLNKENTQQNKFLYEGASHTYITSYVSIMLFVMKHSLTKDAFSDLLFLIRTHVPKDTKFTTSVYSLKEFLKKNIKFEEPMKHFYCDTCGVSLNEGSQCLKPSCRGLNSNSSMFHDLRLERQLAELFKDENFCKLTLDRQSEHEHVADTFKDICDGSEYQRVMSLPKIVPTERNLTFIMNTATECREWLLHYSLPVTSGIQNADISIHYALLVTAVYLLNQESVSGKDVDTAEECLKDFCRLFPTFYDPKKQTMNIHLLHHMPQFVRLHGPLFHYSCFGFESMNNHIKKMVHGTRFINDQICFAVGMTKCLPDLVKSLMVETNSSVKSLMLCLSKHLTW